MHWIQYILLSSLFLAFYDIAKKASVRGNAVLPTLLLSTTFGSLAFVLGLVASGAMRSALAVDARTAAFAFVKSAIVATSWIFTFCALRTLPISIATPIRASAPAIVFLVAFFAYGEVPTLLQGAGMLLVFAGYFAFSWAGRHEGIDFLRNRAVWHAFAGMFLSAVSSLWDKYVFQVAALPVESVQMLFQVFLVFDYALVFAVCRRATSSVRFEWRWSIPCVGTFLALADWLYFRGLAFPGVPISVGSLMRRASVVVTFAVGAAFFRETNLVRKSMALAVILAGLVLLCLP